MAAKAQELRRLMKQQKTGIKKINHPLAKYLFTKIVIISCLMKQASDHMLFHSLSLPTTTLRFEVIMFQVVLNSEISQNCIWVH